MLLEAGHGRVSNGWLVDGALQPWRVGRPLEAVFAAGAAGGTAGGAAATGGADTPEALAAEGRMRFGAQVFEVLASSSSG